MIHMQHVQYSQLSLCKALKRFFNLGITLIFKSSSDQLASSETNVGVRKQFEACTQEYTQRLFIWIIQVLVLVHQNTGWLNQSDH